MSLPRLSIHRDKITLYLLDLTSKRGASKAKFFLGRGFDTADWLTFIEVLSQHGFNHWPGTSIDTPFGEKHVLTGPMPCPNGTTPDVLSVWMLTLDGTTASFVTAYPA